MREIITTGKTVEEATQKALEELGLYGAILGKALYTGAVDLSRALEGRR